MTRRAQSVLALRRGYIESATKGVLVKAVPASFTIV